MKTPSPILCGYTVAVRNPETARNHITVDPPGTLKKPESIKAWREDEEKQRQAWASIDALAPWTKLLGEIDRVVAVDIGLGEYFDSSSDLVTDGPGASFVTWLLRRHKFPEWHGGDYPVVFYAFNPKPLLRIAGQNAIRAGAQVPLGLWYAGVDHHALDPKEMLLETEAKKIYSLRKICGECPTGPVDLPQGYRPHNDPVTDLRITAELCVGYQLIPNNQAATLTDLLSGRPEFAQAEGAEEAAIEEKKPAAKSKKKKEAAAAE